MNVTPSLLCLCSELYSLYRAAVDASHAPGAPLFVPNRSAFFHHNDIFRTEGLTETASEAGILYPEFAGSAHFVIDRAADSGKDVYKRQSLIGARVQALITCVCPLLNSPEPVSYTHLDVYKRQDQIHSLLDLLVDQRFVCLREVSHMNGFLAGQIGVNLVGDKRSDRRDKIGRTHENLVSGGVHALLVFRHLFGVKPSSRPTDIPVGDLIYNWLLYTSRCV